MAQNYLLLQNGNHLKLGNVDGSMLLQNSSIVPGLKMVRTSTEPVNLSRTTRTDSLHWGTKKT